MRVEVACTEQPELRATLWIDASIDHWGDPGKARLEHSVRQGRNTDHTCVERILRTLQQPLSSVN